MYFSLIIVVVLLSSNVGADDGGWLEKFLQEKEKCLREGERNLMTIDVPQQVITLEQLGQYHQLLGYKISELLPITPQGKQLCNKVTAQFKPYKTIEFKRACRDYETLTSVVMKKSECNLLEIVNDQAVQNAKILGENNGVHKCNLYRKACHLLSIA